MLTPLPEGEAQIDVGQWIGSGYDVINNGFIDASLVSPFNAVDKVFLQNNLLNVSDSIADAKTYCSQKAEEIYNSININSEAEYKNVYFSGSVSADYAKATTTKRNENKAGGNIRLRLSENTSIVELVGNCRNRQ